MNNHGQALIEYVLMLIITVSLVLALISQIFRPFGQFVDNYMGSYLACLLEYGELPSLGSSEGSPVDGDSECNKKFAGGTLASGRPPTEGEGGGRGNGSNSTNGKNGSSSSSSGSEGGGGSGGGSSSTYAGSKSRGGSRFVNARRRPSSGVSEASSAAARGKVVEIAADGNGGSGYFGRNNNGNRNVVNSNKTRAIGITGLTEEEKKKIEKKANGGGGAVISADTRAAPPKKMTLKPPEKKMEIREEEPVTVGNFIRYLFIAALIIALLIFVGGQALQMSKSGEK